MIKNIIKQSFIWIIICGCIAYATMVITGAPDNLVLLNAHTIHIGNYTTTLYTFDIHAYLKQLEDVNFNIPWNDLWWSPPQFPNLTNIGMLGKWLVNILIWVANMLLWWLNTIIVAPTKLLILQPLMFVATILGIDLTTLQITRFIYILYTVVQLPQFSYI